MPLAEYLCKTFDLADENLEDFCIRHHKEVLDVMHNLPIYTSHSEARHPLRCDGLTPAGPFTQFARGGILGVNLAQVFYEHTKEVLQYKRLPCIIRWHPDVLGETYYPMELVLVDTLAEVPSQQVRK